MNLPLVSDTMQPTTAAHSLLPTVEDEAACLAGLADAVTGVPADGDRSAAYHLGHEAGTARRASRERFEAEREHAALGAAFLLVAEPPAPAAAARPVQLAMLPAADSTVAATGLLF